MQSERGHGYAPSPTATGSVDACAQLLDEIVETRRAAPSGRRLLAMTQIVDSKKRSSTVSLFARTLEPVSMPSIRISASSGTKPSDAPLIGMTLYRPKWRSRAKWSAMCGNSLATRIGAPARCSRHYAHGAGDVVGGHVLHDHGEAVLRALQVGELFDRARRKLQQVVEQQIAAGDREVELPERHLLRHVLRPDHLHLDAVDVDARPPHDGAVLVAVHADAGAP